MNEPQPATTPEQYAVRHESENSEKPEFALDRWQYTQANLDAFTTRLARYPHTKEGLENTLRNGGGKAFGLVVCKMISENFRRSSSGVGLDVPGWSIVKDVKSVHPAAHPNAMFRSSSLTEDWLDGQSGTFRSFNLTDYDTRRKFEDAQKRSELPEIPFVVQNALKGIGLVIDIGYSSLEGKVVARVASGNERGRAFTSATEDAEAGVGAWDAETGEPIIPTRSFHKSLLGYNDLAANPFVVDLFAAIKKTGIDFGVQLELIFDPNIPSFYNLVQVRPSPKQISSKIPTTIDQEERETNTAPELLAQSAIVNGVFDATRKVRFFTKHDETFQTWHKTSYGHQNALYRREPITLVPQTPERTVGIYLGVLTKDAHPPENFLGAFIEGSDVQLTHSAIMPNSAHADMLWNARPELYEIINQHIGMASFRESDIDRIRKAVTEGGKDTALRVVSDGLLARAYLEKPAESQQEASEQENLKGTIAELNGYFEKRGFAWDKKALELLRTIPKPIVVDLNNVLINNDGPKVPNPEAKELLDRLRKVGTVVICTDATARDRIQKYLTDFGLWQDDIVLMAQQNYLIAGGEHDYKQKEDIIAQVVADFVDYSLEHEREFNDDDFEPFDIASGKRIAPIFKKLFDVPIIDDKGQNTQNNPGMIGFQSWIFEPTDPELETHGKENGLPLTEIAKRVEEYYKKI